MVGMLQRRTVVLMLVVALLAPAVSGVALPRTAFAADPGISESKAGLAAFAIFMDGFGYHEELGQALPLSAASVSSELGLRLDSVFSDSLGQAMIGSPAGTNAALKSAIEAVGDTGGVDVSFTNVAVTGADQIDISFTANLARSAQLPIAYTDGQSIIIDGTRTQPMATIPVQLNWTGAFALRYDPDQLDPLLQFAIVGEPQIAVTASANNAAIPDIDALVGITEVNTSGTATMNIGVNVAFNDPDGDGSITFDELANTLVVDLIDTTWASTTSANITVNLDSPLVGAAGSTDGTIVFNKADFPGVPNPLVPDATLAAFNTITLSTDLDRFTNVTINDALVGLGQMAGLVVAAEARADVRLPFLDASVASVIDAGDKVLSFVQQQTDAYVACGSYDTQPPVGAVVSGGTAYCQASTTGSANGVSWKLAGVAVSSDSNSAGVNPTSNVAITNVQSLAAITLTYTDAEGKAHTVTPRARSIQELAAMLDAAGFSGAATGLAYNAATASLTLPVARTSGPFTKEISYSFGDILMREANLAGLEAVDGAAAPTVTIASASVNATLGIVMVDDLADINPSDTTTERRSDYRFFVKLPDNRTLLTVDGLSVSDTDLNLSGLIGQLGVTATGDKITIGGTSPNIVARVDLTGSTIAVDGLSTISNAKLMKHFFGDISLIEPDFNITAATTLSVKPSGDLSSLVSTTATTTVTANWPDVEPDTRPTVTTSADYNTYLKSFDITPSLYGIAGAGSSASTLTDSSRNFSTDFGYSVANGATVDALLTNLTDGVSCSGFTVVNGQTLACAKDSNGNDVATWGAGDEYEIRRDPSAMGRIILGNLTDLAGALGQSTNATFTQALPIVGVSPQALLLADLALIQEATVAQLTGPVDDADGLITLQDLALALETKLGATATVEFSLSGLDHPDVTGTDTTRHLVVKLALDRLEDTDNTAQISIPLAGVVDGAALTGDDGTNSAIAYTWDPSVNLDIGVPLSPTVSVDSVLALATTDATVQVTVDQSGLQFNASAGAIEVDAGGIKASGTHTAPSGTNTATAASATVLTDSAADFTKLGIASDGTTTVVNVTQNARCVVGTVTATTLTCQGTTTLSDSKQWAQGNAYRLESKTTLYDPAKDFTASGIVAGDTLQLTRNTTTATCLVTSVAAKIVVCSAALSNTATWLSGDSYSISQSSAVKMDTTVTLAPSTTTRINSTLSSAFVGTSTGTVVNCGNDNAKGDACALLALRAADDTILGTLSFKFVNGTATASGAAGLATAAAQEPIDWAVLTDSLPFVTTILTNGLDGFNSNTSLPLIGENLAAGSDVVADFKLIEDELSSGAVAQAAATSTNVGNLKTNIAAAVATAFTTAAPSATRISTIVTVTCGTGGSTACADADALDKIYNVTVELIVGDNLSGTDAPGKGCTNCGTGARSDAVFHAGPLGLQVYPVEGDKSVDAQVGWKLSLRFGVNRRIGAYLDSGNLLALGAAAKLKSGTGSDCDGSPGAGESFDGYNATEIATMFNYGSGRCFDGKAGYLSATYWDKNDEAARSKLDLLTTISLSGQAGVVDLVKGESGTTTTDAEGRVALAFRTNFGDADSGFPTVVGTVAYNYTNGAFGDIAYDNLFLDTGTFISGLLGPTVQEIRKMTKPFEPVIDTLRAPIPVVSEISETTGNGKVTMMRLLEELPINQLEMVVRIIRMIDFVNNIPESSGTLYISLGELGTQATRDAGAFAIPKSTVEKKQCKTNETAPSKVGGQGGYVRRCSVSAEQKGTQGGNQYTKASVVTNMKNGKMKSEKIKQASGRLDRVPPGLSFPFLDDSKEVYGALAGFDTTLVRWDAGQLMASAGMGISFYYVVGPIPLEISISGTISLHGRFAMGFDTRGIRLAALDQESPTGIPLLDGIYIDDLDASKVDVPEVQLITTVGLFAGVTLGIISVGIEGGVELTISLNLNDPDKNGKIYIDELSVWRDNPLCLFDVSGTLEFFLAIAVKTRFFVTIAEVWDIYRTSPPIELFNVSCTPPAPNPADIEGGNLQINIGDRASKRNIATTATDERVKVQQLSKTTTNGTRVMVGMFGVSEELWVPSGGKVIVNATSGKDTIELTPGAVRVEVIDGKININGSGTLSGTGANTTFAGSVGDDDDGTLGVDSGLATAINVTDGRVVGATTIAYAGGGTVNVISGLVDINGDGVGGASDDGILELDLLFDFTLDATINGGDGTDRVTSGGGNDEIRGGNDRDIISSGAGNDKVYGDAGLDSIDGGLGSDSLDGGTDNDTLSGGPGDDLVLGGAGNDSVSGGPGLRPGSPKNHDPALDDGNDVLLGGAGDDDVQGGHGDDSLAGDDAASISIADGPSGARTKLNNAQSATCNNNTSGSGNDKLDGDSGDDKVFGGPGNDDVEGGTGTDFLCGNAGGDTLEGDAEGAAGYNDSLYGGDGNDSLYGRDGHDLLDGGGQVDFLYGGYGNDTATGGTGPDVVRGDAGNDILLGDTGSISGDPAVRVDAEAMRLLVTGVNSGSSTGQAFCADRVDVIDGLLDFNGDGAADSGYFAGYQIIAGAFDIDRSGTINASDSDRFGPDFIVAGKLDLTHNSIADGSDDGTLEGAGVIADGDADCVNGGFGSDALFGGPGGDTMNGDAGRDTLDGNGGSDIVRGGQDDDVMRGGNDNDTMYGDSGFDRMWGDNGADTMRGGIDNDAMAGGSEAAGAADTGDEMNGDAGDDVMAGDNATLQRSETAGVVTVSLSLLDVPYVGQSPSGNASGSDTMYGDSGNDSMYGQSDDSDGSLVNGAATGDEMHGGPDADAIEGNSGADALFGDADDDNIIGGSSLRGSNNQTVSDGRDVIHGDDGDGSTEDAADVILGDNGTITTGTTVDPNTATKVRTIHLFDVEVIGTTVAGGTSAGDIIFGDGKDDRIFGQGGPDELHGGDDADYVEGNHGSDTLYGDAGGDDLIGGGSASDGNVSNANRVGSNLADTGDTIYGDDGDGSTPDGADVIAGDNARTTRATASGGLWVIDINTGDPARNVVLFDIEVVGGAGVAAGASGADSIRGEGDDDRIFGQGNAGNLNVDIDVDRNGALDAGKVADVISGGDGSDSIEGNHGADLIAGDGGDDDITGGGSANDGIIDGDRSGTGLADTSDVIFGGDDDDVVLGDNGVIARPVDASKRWKKISGGAFDIVVRNVTMAESPEQAGAFGADYIIGNAGHDDLYGQLAADYIEGNEGEDAIVGDLGKVTKVLENGRQKTISLKAPFLTDTIFTIGQLTRNVTLFASDTSRANAGGGEDILLGNAGNDWMHGGPGMDFMNGNSGDDRMFGGDGNDYLWGGPQHDHLYGGYGSDHLDVKPRACDPANPAKPCDADARVHTYGALDNYQDMDLLYGGWNADAMQAAPGLESPGKVPGDRLLDWAGAHNIYYVCNGNYGEGVITRQLSPSMLTYLKQLAQADGALNPGTTGTSGFRELGLVTSKDVKNNANPPHPENPGNFTCN